jgi:predicted nuclease with TOPRIM domain
MCLEEIKIELLKEKIDVLQKENKQLWDDRKQLIMQLNRLNDMAVELSILKEAYKNELERDK